MQRVLLLVLAILMFLGVAMADVPGPASSEWKILVSKIVGAENMEWNAAERYYKITCHIEIGGEFEEKVLKHYYSSTPASFLFVADGVKAAGYNGLVLVYFSANEAITLIPVKVVKKTYYVFKQKTLFIPKFEKKKKPVDKPKDEKKETAI